MYAELNPVLLIFASYTVGVFGVLSLKLFGVYAKFENQNFISDRLTKKLGVLRFGWLIRHSFMGMFNQKLKYKGKLNSSTLKQLKSEMTDAEVGHLFAFILLLLFSLYLPFLGCSWWYVLTMFVLNIVFNLYLVFLQQYNKRRIEKILKKQYS